jgi:hypothetical protein
MKNYLFLCAILVLIAIATLPIGFYTLLRIAITIGSGIIIFREYEKGFNFWVIVFLIIGILFNPLIPIYLYDKNLWIPIDVIVAILFFTKGKLIEKENNNN